VPDSTTPTKTCSKCRIEKPLDRFTLDRRKPDGRGSSCLDCENARKRAYREAYPEKHRAACQRWEAAHAEEARAYRRRWVEGHRERERERYRRAYAADPEKHRTKVRASYQRHISRRREESRAYHRANKERYSVRDRARRAAKVAADPVGVRLVQREEGARRRALRHGVVREVVDYAAILARDGFICRLCGSEIVPAAIQSIEFDHLVPIEKGGPHRADNIAVAHVSCNKRKHRKTLEELLAARQAAAPCK
jgi:hypothetical protein